MGLGSNNSNKIKAICKKCGRAAPAEDFILDQVYRLMVCPTCVRERKDKEITAKKIQEKAIALQEELKIKQAEQKNRPPGWDEEDEYLERAYQQKQRQSMVNKYERINADRINYICGKCRYKFAYSTLSKFPKTCPYCGTAVFI